MQDPSLAADIRQAALLRGEFLLRSGQLSDTYFDKYRFEGRPALLKRVAAAMIPLLPGQAELLAGLELGGVPIATALSLETGIPAVFVRKQAKDYGTRLAVEGADVAGRQVVLIEDVITTGGAVADAARLVEQAGAEVIGVVCAIWRGEGAPRLDALPDLPVAAALTRADLEGWCRKRAGFHCPKPAGASSFPSRNYDTSARLLQLRVGPVARDRNAVAERQFR